MSVLLDRRVGSVQYVGSFATVGAHLRGERPGYIRKGYVEP